MGVLRSFNSMKVKKSEFSRRKKKSSKRQLRKYFVTFS